MFLSQHGRPSLKTKKNLTWNGQKNYSPIDIFDWSTSSSFGWRSVWRMKCLQRIKIQGSFERYTRHFFKKIILNKWRKPWNEQWTDWGRRRRRLCGAVCCAGWCAAVAAGKNKTENLYLNQEVIISLCNLVILCLYLPTFKRYCDK